MKNLSNLSPRVLFQNRWRKKTETNWLLQVHLENGHLLKVVDSIVWLAWMNA